LRYRRLKAQLYEWSNDLVLAFLDEDWDAVLAVIRQLSHNSGFLKLIEPSWGNLAEFFEGVGK
jgi:hypothetical protein